MVDKRIAVRIGSKNRRTRKDNSIEEEKNISLPAGFNAWIARVYRGVLTKGNRGRTYFLWSMLVAMVEEFHASLKICLLRNTYSRLDPMNKIKHPVGPNIKHHAYKNGIQWLNSSSVAMVDFRSDPSVRNISATNCYRVLIGARVYAYIENKRYTNLYLQLYHYRLLTVHP